ncbi:16S rRNA (guanine(527)-N(7))-methyltransferase RsmG [bacterium]|nr:16S rRNA (guanine(527)-N(7))-methyltransferase RsmG [bacterium]
MVTDISLLKNYFSLSDEQTRQFNIFSEVFLEKNKVLNLVSRKDAENLTERHLLHSLTIAKYFNLSGAKVLDVGTGGGFPGLPLAIYFPQASFTLVDSKQKKVHAVSEFVQQIGLNNVETRCIRAEELKTQYDFVVSRAVTGLDKFTHWVAPLIKPGTVGTQHKGIIYLRGEDFDFNTINDEIHPAFDCNRIIHLQKDFTSDFFLSKKIVFLQRI